MSNIHHSIIKTSQTLQEFLESQNLDQERAQELLHLGAIYHNKKRARDLQALLQAEDYIRLHLTPRRFRAQEIDIIDENQNWVVINKPAGLPSHPTLDNSIENTKALLERKLQTELSLPHRLDINTSGLMIFAKNSETYQDLLKHFEKREVTKLYRANSYVTELPLPKPSTWTHYMKPSQRCPKELSSTANEGWKVCTLKILSAETVDSKVIFELQLLTGRTHQIRSQLSHEGYPILGDQLYGSSFDISGKPSKEQLYQQNSHPIALQSFCLSLKEKTWELPPAF